LALQDAFEKASRGKDPAELSSGAAICGKFSKIVLVSIKLAVCPKNASAGDFCRAEIGKTSKSSSLVNFIRQLGYAKMVLDASEGNFIKLLPKLS
jgi:hypothetical protein